MGQRKSLLSPEFRDHHPFPDAPNNISELQLLDKMRSTLHSSGFLSQTPVLAWKMSLIQTACLKWPFSSAAVMPPGPCGDGNFFTTHVSFTGRYTHLVEGIPCMFYFFFVNSHPSLQNCPLWSSKGGCLLLQGHKCLRRRRLFSQFINEAQDTAALRKRKRGTKNRFRSLKVS